MTALHQLARKGAVRSSGTARAPRVFQVIASIRCPRDAARSPRTAMPLAPSQLVALKDNSNRTIFTGDSAAAPFQDRRVPISLIASTAGRLEDAAWAHPFDQCPRRGSPRPVMG